MRISKSPEIRKQEILDTAMKLFYKKGYEKTSMNDIAKELNVVQGLCYRYFDSKQSLFNEAINQSIEQICTPFLKILKNRNENLDKRIDNIINFISTKEMDGRYSFFFHKQGNEIMHEQLTIKMCKKIIPYMNEELNYLSEKGEIKVNDINTLTQFIMYGQLSLWQSNDTPYEKRIYYVAEYIRLLLKKED